MIPHRRVWLAGAVGFLMVACAGTYFGSPGKPGHRNLQMVLAACSSATDSTYLRETEALFHIIDRHFCKDSLHVAPDVSTFRKTVERYAATREYETRPDTPEKNEWWEEMMVRMAYGRAHYATTILDPMRDIRWELLLQLGIPSFERRLPREFLYEIYVLYWENLDREIACRSLRVGQYPVQIIPWDRDERARIDPSYKPKSKAVSFRDLSVEMAEVLGTDPEVVAFPELKKPIRSNIGLYVFPDPDGSFSVWAATLTGSDQFTPQSLENDRLAVDLLLYDSSQTLVMRRSSQSKGLAALADGSTWTENSVPAYVGLDSLAAGRYEAVISVIGSGEENKGVFRARVDIPSPQVTGETSDLVVTFPLGQVRGAGIRRADDLRPANPVAIVRNGGTIDCYLEFVPPRNDGEYEASAWLFPIRRSPGGETEISIGPIFRVEDTRGEVWSDTVGQFPADLPDEKSAPLAGGQNVFRKSYPAPAGTAVFAESIPLQGIKAGRYYLLVRVTGREDQASRLAWTSVEIR